MVGIPAATSHAFLTFGFGQQRPVTHRAAIDYGAHADIDQLATLGHQRIEVRFALGGARGHQGRHATGEDVVAHCFNSLAHHSI
jgi:hypothetical protein